MIIGSFGDIVFATSSVSVLVPNNIGRNIGKRTATHEVIEGKPLVEYLGPDLQTITFDINLRAEYGVRPRKMLDKLAEMAESNEAFLLQIGGKPIGEHSWVLDSISETWDNIYSGGELSEATVKLSLTEYIEEVATN